LSCVILPAENSEEYQSLPEDVTKGMEVVLIHNVDELIARVLMES
jgi:ATP-dependent Lon protease